MFRIVIATTAALVLVAPQAAVGQKTDRDKEMTLARSAGPADVGRNATVYVLGAKGYERAATGTNGFSCFVDHERPDTVEPVCYDAEGSATLVPPAMDRAAFRAAGVPETEIEARIARGYREGKYRAPSRPGIAYMLATEQSVYDPGRDKVIPYVPHLMFYAPYLKAADLGFSDDGQSGQPFLINEGRPDAMVIVTKGH